MTKMTLEEFTKALSSNEFIDLSTQFNENKQTTFTARTFSRLRFVPQVSKLLFIPLLLSFPFNPATGTADENYNMRKRYRPFVQPEIFLRQIKSLCDENPELKQKYMNHAGFSGVWDTTESEDFTMADRAILFIYRRPMSSSHPSISINSQAISGNKYGGKMLLNTKQDEVTGEYAGELSLLHRLGMLNNTIQRAEVNSFNQAIENGVADCISINLGRSFLTAKSFTEIKAADSDQAKNIRQNIRGAYPIGGISPVTVMPMIGFDTMPLTGKLDQYVVDPNDSTKEELQLLPHFRNDVEFESSLLMTDKYRIHNNVNDVIGHYFPKDPAKKIERNVDADTLANFAVLQYVTNSSALEFTDQERMAEALKMETKTMADPLFNRRTGWVSPEIKEFYEKVSKFYDFAQVDNFASRMPELMLSNYQVASEAVEERALSIFGSEFNITGEFEELFTKDTIAMHSDVIMHLWPEEFTEKFDEVEEHLEEGSEKLEELLLETSDADSDSVAELEEDLVTGAPAEELDLNSLTV